MNIHHRCLDVTVEQGILPYVSLYGVAKAALYYAHQATVVYPNDPSKLARPFSSREGGLFGLPLRASNEHLPSVRVARAQEANRPPSHSSHFPPLRPQGEWPRLPFTARIGRAPSERARSASKKGTWPLPSHSSFDRGTPSWLRFLPLDSPLLLRAYCLRPPLFKGVGV